MIKIALVVPGYECGGGVPTVAEFLRAALLKNGEYETELFSLSTSWRDPESTRFTRPHEWLCSPTTGRVAVAEGATAVRIGARFAEWELQRYRPRRLVTLTLSGFDLIQVVAGSAAWAVPCLKACCPVFVQVATTLEAERRSASGGRGLSLLVRRLITRLARPLEKKGLRESTGVFVENRWMANYANSLRNGRGVYFAPPGVDTDYLFPKPSIQREHLLFVGRMDDRRKNLALLIKAYARYLSQYPDGVPLVLAGYRGPLIEHQQMIKSLGLSTKIKIQLGLAKAELRSLYQRAKLVVLSSNEEGLGMVLVEAMACGAPVISTDCGGPRSIVSDGRNGVLVPVGDVEGFALALGRLLSDCSVLESMGEEARRTVLKDFSHEAAGRRFTTVYENTLLERRRASNASYHC